IRESSLLSRLFGSSVSFGMKTSTVLATVFSVGGVSLRSMTGKRGFICLIGRRTLSQSGSEAEQSTTTASTECEVSTARASSPLEAVRTENPDDSRTCLRLSRRDFSSATQRTVLLAIAPLTTGRRDLILTALTIAGVRR